MVRCHADGFCGDLANHTEVPIPPRTNDARDRLAFPNYEAHGQLTFEETLPSAGSINDTNVSVKEEHHRDQNFSTNPEILGQMARAPAQPGKVLGHAPQ